MTSTRLGCWCSLLILLIHVTEAMASPVGVTTDSIATSCPAAKEKHYLYSLMVNDGTEPDAHYAFSDMIEVVQMFETNAQLQQVLDSRLVPETLSFSTGATEMGVGDYLQSNTVHFIHGLTPSTVLIPDAVLVVDPITSAPSTRRTERNFVYLFSTIGQQLMVVMEYLSLKMLCANAALRTSTGLSTDEEALFNVVKLTAGYYGVSMCSMKTFKDDIASALVVNGITIVGGLTASNIAPLVAFLDTHPLAKVVVLFDEFTLLYHHIGLSYPTIYSLSMDRLLFVTNLPRWTFAPDNPRAVTLATYFKVFHRNMRSPASLRTFLAICTIDVLARHTPGNHVAQLSVDDFYTGKVVGLDSSFEAGPFHHYCKYPTRSPALCLENSGARNMKLMSYGSTLYSRKEKYIFGPVTVQVVVEEDHHLVVLYDNSFNNPYLYIILAMMSFLTMLLLASWILGETSCLWGDLSIQATVGFVAVRRGSANLRPSELGTLLSELSDEVALLVKKHHCVEVECTSHSFAVVGRSAADVVHLMQELHDAQQKLCELHNVSKLVDFRVGVHTALCSVERAWLNGDVTALFCAVAPLLMLAHCVADISLPKEVWATQWTVQALHSAMKSKVAGVYRLDDECIFVTVYRL